MTLKCFGNRFLELTGEVKLKMAPLLRLWWMQFCCMTVGDKLPGLPKPALKTG